MKRNFFLLSVIGIVLAIGYAYILAFITGYQNPVQYIQYNIIGGFLFWLMLGGILVIWAIAVSFSDVKTKSNYGDAKWAKKRDIKKMGLFADNGIIYGKVGNRFIRTNEPLSALIAAPPGTGKTAAIAIPNLLSCNNSMIINDVKNELWEITATHRKKYQQVIRFAPTEKDSHSWNPLAEIPDNEIDAVVHIDRILSVIYQTTGNEKDDHWQRMSKSVVKFYALMLLYNKVPMSLAKIRSEILDTSDLQVYVTRYIENDFYDPDTADEDDKDDGMRPKYPPFINDGSVIYQYILETGNLITQVNSKEFSSVLTTMISKLEIFADPIVASNTSKSDFSIKQLRQSKASIYLCTRPKDLARAAPIIKIFIEIAANEFLSDKPRKEQKVTFLLDEFARMGKLDTLIKLPAVSRGQNANVVLICQDLDQIKSVYKETGLNEILSTTAHKVVFTQNNYNTMRRISELIGKQTKTKTTETRQKNQLFADKSNQISEEGQALILPQDVGSLKDNEVIIITQGYNTQPIKAKTAKYYEIKQMRKLALMPEQYK